MKPFLPAAATVALLALASPVSAQMYGSTSAPGDNPGTASVDGPQWQTMTRRGFTTTDTQPYAGNDFFSDDLNERGLAQARTRIYVQPPAPQWEPQ